MTHAECGGYINYSGLSSNEGEKKESPHFRYRDRAGNLLHAVNTFPKRYNLDMYFIKGGKSVLAHLP